MCQKLSIFGRNQHIFTYTFRPEYVWNKNRKSICTQTPILVLKIDQRKKKSSLKIYHIVRLCQQLYMSHKKAFLARKEMNACVSRLIHFSYLNRTNRKINDFNGICFDVKFNEPQFMFFHMRYLNLHKFVKFSDFKRGNVIIR